MVVYLTRAGEIEVLRYYHRVISIESFRDEACIECLAEE